MYDLFQSSNYFPLVQFNWKKQCLMDFESWVTGDSIRQFSDLCNYCHMQLHNLPLQLISCRLLPITSSVFSLSCVLKLWSGAPGWPTELVYVLTVKQAPIFDPWNGPSPGPSPSFKITGTSTTSHNLHFPEYLIAALWSSTSVTVLA